MNTSLNLKACLLLVGTLVCFSFSAPPASPNTLEVQIMEISVTQTNIWGMPSINPGTDFVIKVKTPSGVSADQLFLSVRQAEFGAAGINRLFSMFSTAFASGKVCLIRWDAQKNVTLANIKAIAGY